MDRDGVIEPKWQPAASDLTASNWKVVSAPPVDRFKYLLSLLSAGDCPVVEPAETVKITYEHTANNGGRRRDIDEFLRQIQTAREHIQ